eukprot:197810-Amorphochlora_amoeboformis.AAC.1
MAGLFSPVGQGWVLCGTRCNPGGVGRRTRVRKTNTCQEDKHVSGRQTCVRKTNKCQEDKHVSGRQTRVSKDETYIWPRAKDRRERKRM